MQDLVVHILYEINDILLCNFSYKTDYMILLKSLKNHFSFLNMKFIDLGQPECTYL